jgi:hypothetical protein
MNTLKANSHMTCCAPAILRQCRVLRESPRGSQKYPNCWSYSFTDWYTSYNLRGTPRGSRKKTKAGRLSTCRLWTADANSHIPCHAMPMLRRAVALKSHFKNGMSWHGRARHGRGVAWARRGMGAAWHGRGVAWARRGMGAAWHVWIKHGRIE